MISETIRYHGTVFAEIARVESNLQISQYDSKSKSSYIVNGVGVFIKYSTKRMSPWSFTFLRGHQEEIDKMKNDLGDVVITLVCGTDGIACLSYDELKQVLNHNIEEVERIGVSRPPRGKYRINGTDGKYKGTIGKNEFPGKIFHLSKKQKNKFLVFNKLLG